MSDHYSLLIRPDLTIDRAILMRMAHARAARERAACIASGWDRPYRKCLAEEMHQLWDIVHGRLATLRTPREPAADEATRIRDALTILPFRTDYRAAQIQRHALEAKLTQIITQ